MILICGVTGSGKGRLAFEIAKEMGGEIISVDSMKVYRRMDIGTAKPPLERREEIRHHMVDIVEPSASFSVGTYIELCEVAIDDIRRRGKIPVAVGGTALYIKSLLYGLFDGPGADEAIRERIKAEAAKKGLAVMHAKLMQVDPEAALRIHCNDERRIVRALEVYEVTGRPISSYQNQWEGESRGLMAGWRVIGLRREKELESRRINARVKKMVDMGLVDEVRGLTAEEKPLSKQARAAIGYAEIIDHFEGKWSLDEAIEKIKINTRRLAKGQRTWFKTFREIYWLDVAEEDAVESVAEKAHRIIDSC